MLEAAVFMYSKEVSGICLQRNYSAKKKFLVYLRGSHIEAATDDEII